MRLADARHLAEQLINQFHLTGWEIQFDGTRQRFGQCRPREREIGLSRNLVLLNSPAEVEETIRHEIAHAIAGCHHQHNIVWMHAAVLCGCKPVACYDTAIVTAAPKYVGKCPTCNRSYNMNRRRGGRTYMCRADKTPIEMILNPVLAKQHAIEVLMNKHKISEAIATQLLGGL